MAGRRQKRHQHAADGHPWAVRMRSAADLPRRGGQELSCRRNVTSGLTTGRAGPENEQLSALRATANNRAEQLNANSAGKSAGRAAAAASRVTPANARMICGLIDLFRVFGN